MVGSVTTTEPEWSAADFAQMQALAIYEASLCPGCNRPMDICAADYESGVSYVVDTHTCTVALSRAVQQRIDEWEHTETGKRSAVAPMDARWSDGRFYAPRLATPEELDD